MGSHPHRPTPIEEVALGKRPAKAAAKPGTPKRKPAPKKKPATAKKPPAKKPAAPKGVGEWWRRLGVDTEAQGIAAMGLDNAEQCIRALGLP